jgi:hypothetical protein
MVDAYVLIGGNGILGKQVAKELLSRNRICISLSARDLIRDFENGSISPTKALLERIRLIDSIRCLGLIFAHRYRGDNCLESLRIELSLTRNLVWELSSELEQLRVVVLGSVTGSRLDVGSSEAYHYAKDLQKSICLQSIRLSNVSMNLIELSWFEKYPRCEQTASYAKKMEDLKNIIGSRNLPTTSDISDYLISVMECHLSPRGQILSYDGGYNHIQF